MSYNFFFSLIFTNLIILMKPTITLLMVSVNDIAAGLWQGVISSQYINDLGLLQSGTYLLFGLLVNLAIRLVRKVSRFPEVNQQRQGGRILNIYLLVPVCLSLFVRLSFQARNGFHYHYYLFPPDSRHRKYDQLNLNLFHIS